MYNLLKLFYFPFFLLVGSNAHGQVNDQAEEIDYKFVDMKSQVMSAVEFDGNILALGPRIFMKFDPKFLSAHFSGPHHMNGYIGHIRKESNQALFAAGHNFRGRSFSGLDSRQNIILRINPMKLATGQILRTRALKDRLSLGLQINRNKRPVLLSTGDGHYTLSVFDRQLRNIGLSKQFGSGGKGDLAITSQGGYAVVGFEEDDRSSDDIPTYWEFDEKLELLIKKRLGVAMKKSGNGNAIMKLLTYQDDAYVAYGWDDSGVKTERPGEVRLEKLKGHSSIWDTVKLFPYRRGMGFYMSQNGNPYMLDPGNDAIYRTTIRRSDGRVKMTVLNRPIASIQCFPPNHYYTIVDVLPVKMGADLIVISGNPLNHREAGCVTIGLMPDN